MLAFSAKYSGNEIFGGLGSSDQGSCEEFDIVQACTIYEGERGGSEMGGKGSGA